MDEKQLPSGQSRLNRVEALFCFGVLGFFSVMALLMSIDGWKRDAALKTTVMSLFYVLLALLPIGISLEIVYRRRKVHGAVMLCLLLTVFIWIMFACLLFPDR